MIHPSTRLWVIGGTSDSIKLASELAAQRIPCLVTVTTEVARRAFVEGDYLVVRVGVLAVETLASFVEENRIGAILDASHPFAVEVSRGAIAVSQTLDIPYWRYERPSLTNTTTNGRLITHVASLEQALTDAQLRGERVLLILGYRWLAQFQPWQEKAILFARILPSVVALETAFSSGFTPDRLIALRPPIDEGLEAALWQQWKITRVITKASGTAGGEDIKQAVSHRLGIPLTIIGRPKVDYPALCHCYERVKALCQQWWQSVDLNS